MESLKNLNFKEKLEQELKKNYEDNLKDDTFKSLVTKLKLDSKVGMMNNSKLEDSACDLKSCGNCKGLYECQNKVIGHYQYPVKVGNILELNYVPCKYKRENDKLLLAKNNSLKELENARFKDIDVTDKNRVKVIKWLKDFYDHYDGITPQKGLYLHGSFGSGKTYLIYALLNELKASKRVDYTAIYYPKALSDLKDDWDSYSEKIYEYSNVPILFLDDIGAESVSEWGRDEVLGTILQSRMNSKLPTFFTSNLTIDELERHLSIAKNTTDEVKSRRIIERIKQLTVDMEMIAENKRK